MFIIDVMAFEEANNFMMAAINLNILMLDKAKGKGVKVSEYT